MGVLSANTRRCADGGLKPFKSSRCIEASYYVPENRLNFPTAEGFRMKISMKLFYQYIVIFFNFSPTSNHLHPLQVENCDSNSRLVVDEDDNGKFKLERVGCLQIRRPRLNSGICRAKMRAAANAHEQFLPVFRHTRRANFLANT